MRMRSAAVSIVGVTMVLVSPLAAQSTGSGVGPVRFGVLAGVNLATVGGSDAEDPGRRTALLVGAYLVKPLSGGLSIRPEVLYSQKGAEESFTEDDVSVKATIELTYIDIPVLLQYEAGSAGSARPHFYAGPSVGINIACDLSGSGGGISVSADCDESEVEVETLDLGAVIGGGLSFPLAGLDATIGARYQHGLSDIAKDAKIQNRVISLYGSVEFGRR